MENIRVVPIFVYTEVFHVLENDIVRLTTCDSLHGRRKILTNKQKITSDNVVSVLEDSLGFDSANVAEINYLYDVYRGIMDIRYKDKSVRPDNNNKVTINLPNKIVTFKSSFFLSSPIQYVAANGKEDISDKVAYLNVLMTSEGKESKDKECSDWMHICGVEPRMVLPDPDNEKDGSPAALYSLDPREAFVIYSSGIGRKPLAGVLKQYDEDDNLIYYVYVPEGRYTVKGNDVVDWLAYDFGRVPIVEYPLNEARLGAFETVLSPINMINTLESARVDNVVDFVNAYDVFQNCEIDENTYKELASGGQCICIRSGQGTEAKVYRISSEISQTGVQTEIDALYDYIDEITGMPTRAGNSSAADTGMGTRFRNGWQDASARANDTEKLFARSEREILKLILKIYKDKGILDLDPNDVKIQFTRENLTDIQSKAQVLCELLNNEKVHPRDAYDISGLFTDVENAYQRGMEWYEEAQSELENSLEKELENARTVHNDGQSDRNTAEEDNTAV